MPLTLPLAPNISVATMHPPVPTMNLTASTPTMPSALPCLRKLKIVLENCANNRAERKALGEEVRIVQGRKPHVVEVTNKGKIDGACDEKNVSGDMLRSAATHYLDVSIVHVSEQNPKDMGTLQARMDGLFDYNNNPLCRKGFEDSVRRFLKGERFCLKNLFTKQGQ